MSRSCYNKTYAAGYWTSERVIRFDAFNRPRIEMVPRWITHTMSRDCRYDRRDDDKACVGCKWNPPSVEDVVLCHRCGDWTVLDGEGICGMCGQECRHVDHDDFDMER